MITKLGELLIQEQLIDKRQLDTALKQISTSGGRLENVLVGLGFVTDEDITNAICGNYGIPSINLSYFDVDSDVLRLISLETAQKYQIVPLSRVGSTLTIAAADPTNVADLDDIKFMTGLAIEPVVASISSIREAIEKYYGTQTAIELKKVFQEISGRPSDASIELDLTTEQIQEKTTDELQNASEEAPIIKLVNMIIAESLKRGASDIHIEPYEHEFRVRYRIDGILQLSMTPPVKLKDAVTSRLKIMAKLDISEKRLPQDGRIKLRTQLKGENREIDFRVSTLPTLFGEKIVLRILDKSSLPLDMTKLGFEPISLTRFDEAILKPYGMVLVTGPTGSGKTCTLYSAINKLNKPETNIMTAEDPVEFNFPGINQVHVREQIGLTFASALRSFLRQDPNIILVGEIRDFETAEIAIKAALTGHLVLSTLHTNDAPSSINRLLNMGIEPFLVATSVHLICAQRLIRKICQNCREEQKVPIQSLLDLGVPAEEAAEMKVFRGVGCKSCNGNGYRGRIGLYEVMQIGDEVQELILIGASARELRRKAVEEGMITLRRSGILKIQQGLTSIEEVVRETVNV